MKLNKTKITMGSDDIAEIKLKNPTRKVKWSISMKKYGHIYVVKEKKNSTCQIFTDHPGRTGKFKVTAKVGKKKFVCTIKVKDADDSLLSNSQTYAESFDKLKEYIQQNGYTNNNYDKFISAKLNQDKRYGLEICYHEYNDTLDFIMFGKIPDYNYVAKMSAQMIMTREETESSVEAIGRIEILRFNPPFFLFQYAMLCGLIYEKTEVIKEKQKNTK